jgi:hypothetical protein
MALMLGELRAPRSAVLAGSLVYPLALTAAWYEPGASMLSGLALAPLAAWFWLRGTHAAGGAVLGLLVLFKANLALVAAAPMVAFLLLGVPDRPRHRQVAAAVAGFASIVVVAALFLAARGELGAYLDILEYNVYYSDAGLRSQGGSGGTLDHLRLVREFFLASGKWQWPAALGALGLLLITVAVAWRRHGRPFQLLSAVAITTLLATVVTLAMTAVFREHLQMLAYAAALAAATVVAAASRSLGTWAGLAVAAACVVFAAWSSLKHEDIGNLSLQAWSSAQASTPGAALEDTRVRFFGKAERVPYMVFGRNTEDGHAAFVGDQLSLECRWFHQYPFYREEQFSEILECARRRRPMLVLVTQSFYDPMPDQPRWEAFVSRARRLLEARYEIVTELGMSQVWKHRQN